MAILNLKLTFDGYLRADNKLGFSVLFSPPIEEQSIYFFSVFTGIFIIIFLLIFLFVLLFIKHILVDLIDENGNSGAAIIILMKGFASGIKDSYNSFISEFNSVSSSVNNSVNSNINSLNNTVKSNIDSNIN